MPILISTGTDPRSVRLSACIMERDMGRIMSRLLHDESGATVIEYGLIALLIATLLFAALNSIGTALVAQFNNVNASF